MKFFKKSVEELKQYNSMLSFCLNSIIFFKSKIIYDKETVKAVIERKGDYVGALKGNQGNFYQDVIDYFDEDRLLIIQSGYEGGYSLTREKSHSKIITYEYYQTEKVKWYAEHIDWEKLRSIGLVIKTVEKKAAYNLLIMKKNALSILNMAKEEYKLSMKKIRFKACLNLEIEVPKCSI